MTAAATRSDGEVTTLLAWTVAGGLVIAIFQLSSLLSEGVGDPSVADALGLGILFWGRSLGLLAPGVLVAALLTRGGRKALGRRAAIGWILAIAVYVRLDLHVSATFGRSLVEYVEYWRDPEIVQWVGSLGALGLLRAQVLPLLALAAVVWVAGRVARRHPRPVRVAALTIGLTVALGVPAALGIAARRGPGTPGFVDRAPGSWLTPWIRSGDNEDVIDRSTDRIVARFAERLRAVPPAPRLLEPPRQRPDVLLLVIESFRADALDPETMPNLWALSRRGARFTEHYAGSSASHGGLFSLLYGRPPLNYRRTLESGRLPDLPLLLREAGYDTHLVSGARLDWRMMERYLLEPAFDRTISFATGTFPERDRQVVARIAEILAESTGPVFVVGFLMSTHFPYVSPPDHRPFGPVQPVPGVADPSLREREDELRVRYRNAAHFVDSLIADLWRGRDLANLLVVVTGDHGESIFDDGTLAHASRVSDAQTKVPLAIAGAGAPEGHVETRLTGQVNILPTVLGRLGARIATGGAGDLFAPDGLPEYVPILRVGPDAPIEYVLLRSLDRAYYFHLSKGEVRNRVRGRHDEFGLPIDEEPTQEDVDRSLRWLEDFLERWTPAAS